MTRDTSIGDQYLADYRRLGSKRQVARLHKVTEKTVREAIARAERREGLDPGLRDGMAALGLNEPPRTGWIKSQEPDENGRTYSYFVRPDELEVQDAAQTICETLSELPPVQLPPPPAEAGHGRVGFLPLNDLHAGALAWGKETGYGDWDTDRAVERLRLWVGTLLQRMPVCDEVILFFNGDTVHMNDQKNMTPGSGHILDADTRYAKVVNVVAATIMAVTDMAAACHHKVSLVIRKGNHDPEATIALQQAAKWRYATSDRVEVDIDPEPFWARRIGKIMLYGHHGDRIKADQLVMKMMSDHRKDWGKCEHGYIWTAHLHDRELLQRYGINVERASCLTNPDAYGAKWGKHAMAQAIVYSETEGEVERFTVKAGQRE